MTKLLATPEGWPQVLLAARWRSSRAGRRARDRHRPRRGVAPGRSRACAGPIASLGPTATIADGRARPGLRGRGGAGLPDRRRSGAPRANQPMRRALRRRQRLRRRSRRRARTIGPHGARPVGDPRGGRDRRVRDRRDRGRHRRPRRATRDGDPPARRARSSRPRRRASWATDVLGAGLRRHGRPSAPSRARTCWARRRSCSRRSRASAASPSSGRRTRRDAACSASRPSSTTSRRWPPCRGSSRNGAAAFAAIGAPRAPGTILVQVRGPDGGGIAEVPLGTPLREIVGSAGGAGSGTLKAVLVGGPTGGLLPPDLLDTPYDVRRAARRRRATSARARWSSPTSRRASSTWPGC